MRQQQWETVAVCSFFLMIFLTFFDLSGKWTKNCGKRGNWWLPAFSSLIVVHFWTKICEKKKIRCAHSHKRFAPSPWIRSCMWGHARLTLSLISFNFWHLSGKWAENGEKKGQLMTPVLFLVDCGSFFSRKLARKQITCSHPQDPQDICK